MVANITVAGPGVEGISELGTISRDEYVEVGRTWADVEDDPLVRDVEIEELLQGLEEKTADIAGESDDEDLPSEDDSMDTQPPTDISEAEVDASMLSFLNFYASRGNPEMLLAARKLDHMLRDDRAAHKLLLQPPIHAFFPAAN